MIDNPECYGNFRVCNGCMLCELSESCYVWTDVMRDRLLDMREDG